MEPMDPTWSQAILNKTWDSWTDIAGNEYQAGDYVVYASVSGSAANLAFAKVLRINAVDSKGDPIVETKRKFDHQTKKWDTVSEVPSATITVQVVEKARGGDFVSSFSKRKDGTRRATTIQNHRNVAKVEPGYLNQVEAIREQYA